MIEISADNFFKHVPVSYIQELLGDPYYTKSKLKSDYAISYYKLKTDDLDVYVFKHSAIEYIFKKI
jgi:hypothetical protein